MKTIIAFVASVTIAAAALVPSIALADKDCVCSGTYIQKKDGTYQCKGKETCEKR